MEREYLKYLESEINKINESNRNILQKSIEDYFNDEIAFGDLSLSAYQIGLDDYLLFNKRIVIDSILSD